MSVPTLTDLRDALGSRATERVERVISLGQQLAEALDAGQDVDAELKSATVDAIVEMVGSGEGPSKLRLKLGEVLAQLGDPRLRGPNQADYWVSVDLDLGPVQVGRFAVTIAEWKRFVAEGGYSDDALWDDEGRAWRDGIRHSWVELAARQSVAHLMVENQPVVGVSWFEAMAYATKHTARLLSFSERMQVVRGPEKRPYPWGAPFGQGNANTREQVLERPCAVGLFVRDVTPEGIYDLAGNVGEWTSDRVGDDCILHPGSWEQTSMAAWAKARSLEPAKTRGASLGFRLARDVD